MTSVTFDVPIHDDNILEDNETFTLVIMANSLPSKVRRGTPGRATITIINFIGKSFVYADSLFSIIC